MKTNRPKLLWFYTPRATDKRYSILDTSESGKDAVKFGTILERSTVSIRRAFFCVGGITLLLPLFSEQYRPKKSDNIDLNMQLVALLAQMLNANEHYQEEMLRTRFFPIMGYLLSGTKGHMWSKEAVITLENLSSVITNSMFF